jgi:adenine-specific DNA-methyltransferase
LPFKGPPLSGTIPDMQENETLKDLATRTQEKPSFGNNLNHWTEAAMGSALDLWTAHLQFSLDGYGESDIIPAMQSNRVKEKESGAYYTPLEVAASLVKWAVRRPCDRMLDPSCGDGRFLALHRNSTGVEQDANALAKAVAAAPWATVREGDFFSWANDTSDRFDCAAGNPPFIRYQRWQGEVRHRALALCERLGASFSSLTSSWAPFLVAASSVLKPGGRMAFVVPAEIGHASYAVPLLEYLARNFETVQIIAIRRKVFVDLSEDCWFLYADGFSDDTDCFRITCQDEFSYSGTRPHDFETIPLEQWHAWRCRMRPFLLPGPIRALYRRLADGPYTLRLGDMARVGIGYVTGANDFFHLRPSQAADAHIPEQFLHPSIRNGRVLPEKAVTHATVRGWLNRNEPTLLLRIAQGQPLPPSVQRYLGTPEALEARQTYKCRTREPWYVVPDVQVPDAFLSCMSGNEVALVANHARCVCTNSVHAVTLKNGMSLEVLQHGWDSPLARLSCEIEGHPLGGGLLKLEPREAANLVIPNGRVPTRRESSLLNEGIDIMRRWRHYG